MLKRMVFLLFFVMIPSFSSAEKNNSTDIPAHLKEWTSWVMHSHEKELNCVSPYNNSNDYLCSWPSKLALDFNEKGGGFVQSWRIETDQYLQLPGDKNHWPIDVTVNGEKSEGVIDRNGVPSVYLKKGSVLLAGQFIWQSMPEYFQIPVSTGLVDFVVNNKKVTPEINGKGRVWLKAKATEKKEEDSVDVQVHRLIDDQIPTMMELRMVLRVSGVQREINFGPIFDSELFTPVSLNSALTARLEKKGELNVQVRPGEWVVKIILRKTAGVFDALTIRFPESNDWPEDEVWVFRPQPSLRLVKVENVPAIDPTQTTLPNEWQNLSAFYIKNNSKIIFKQIKRGSPNPAPDQLTLDRTLWLHFNGDGYTVKDLISGVKNNNWRLNAHSDRLSLGRVNINGVEQLITLKEGEKTPGIEMRQGRVNMQVDSTIMGDIATIPATGYETTFQKVKVRLNLPPGYRVLAATSVDNIYPTWLKRWDLLNLFILLITTLGAVKLFGFRTGICLLTTLVLIQHDRDAPIYIWPFLLMTIALLRVVSEGKIKRVCLVSKNVFLFSVLLISIPFMVIQLRTAIYPQLEEGHQFSATNYERESLQMATSAMVEAENMPMDAVRGRGMKKEARMYSLASAPPQKDAETYSKRKVIKFDPETITQTGPGLPSWLWNVVSLDWVGPVVKEQDVRLVLLTPKVNLMLGFIKCLLLSLSFVLVSGISFKKGSAVQLFRFFLLVVSLAAFNLFTPQIAGAGDQFLSFPNQELLQSLEQRLLEKDDCYPFCASINSLNIMADDSKLVMELIVTAINDTAIPLPGYLQQWAPQMVSIQQKSKEVPATLLRRKNNLWALVAPGLQKITLTSVIPSSINTVQITMPLVPSIIENGHMKGWVLEGLNQYKKSNGSIQLKRIASKQKEKGTVLEAGILPPFFVIERTLHLGLDWQIETTIKRVSPPGASVTLKIPLLPGEAITTGGILVKDGYANITVNPGSRSAYWQSSLKKDIEITLKHPETTEWTEIWKVEPSVLWNLEYSGAPVIHHKSTSGEWFPTWHPLPGETVQLLISRPKGISGKTVTIDTSLLEVRPGKRSSGYKLSFTMRSSQGGQHKLTCPDAEVQKIIIDSRDYPIQKDASNNIIIPIHPGSQEVEIAWQDSAGIENRFKTPAINLGSDSVNANLKVFLGSNRWPIYISGPVMGPAILFYSVLLVILVVSFGLSKCQGVPLKFHHWFFLGLGLSQVHIGAAAIVVVWLFALSGRRKIDHGMSKGAFNFCQLGLVVLTIIALLTLIAAISKGLLGTPEMQIVGNHSSSSVLNFYLDQTTSFPQATIISLPMFIYRLLMLVWALWLSFRLLEILKWAWVSFSYNEIIWHTVSLSFRKKKEEGPEAKDSEKVT